MSIRNIISVCVLTFLLFQQESKADTFTFVVSEYPPYQYIENGEPKGLTISILREAFRRAGHRFNVKFVPWSRVLKNIEVGKADFATGLFTEERARYANYSAIPVNKGEISLFVKAQDDIHFSGNLNELSDRKFLGVMKYSYGKIFDQAIKDKIIKNVDRTISSENAVLMLRRGRGDTLVADRAVAIDIIMKKGWSNDIKELRPSIDIQPTLLMYSKKKNLFRLRKKIDVALQTMMDDGTFKRLSFPDHR